MRKLLTAALLLAVCAALSAAPASANVEAGWVNYPAISSGGKTVYFSAWGDIWSAPADGSASARRLTDNVAYDSRPILSHDGKWIAFLSNRFSQGDVYLMSVDGGPATRLTYGDQYAVPYDFSPDNGKVLFYGYLQDFWAPGIYEVSVSGGMPKRITGPDYENTVWCRYCGGEGRIIYSRGPGYAEWSRKRHTGSDTYDIWAYDTAAKRHSALNSTPGNDMWPMPTPDGKQIYFVSMRSGTENLWVMDADGSHPRQLTQFQGDGVAWPQLSPDGATVAFTVFGRLYAMSLPGGAPRQIKVSFDGDPKRDLHESVQLNGNISEYALSPNGKYFALVVWGDIYILKNPDSYKDPATGQDKKPDQDLSRAIAVVKSDGRDMQVSWSPRNNAIAYVSDRPDDAGLRQFDVYTLDLATKEEKRLTAGSDDDLYPLWSPDGSRIAYSSGNRKLMIYDVKAGSASQLLDASIRMGPWGGSFMWSPDGKWLSYNDETPLGDQDVFIINLADRKPIQISKTPDYDFGGIWSKDGKWLAWVHGDGESGSKVMLLELSPRKREFDTSVLFPEDMPKPEEKPAEPAKETDKPKADTDKAKDATRPEGDKPRDATPEAKPEEPGPEAAKPGDDEPKLPEVKVDFTRIDERSQVLTPMPGNASFIAFDPQSKFMLISSDHEGQPGVYSLQLAEDKRGQLIPLPIPPGSSLPYFAPDSSRLYGLNGGSIGYLDLAGPGPGPGGGMVPSTVHMELDHREIWDQMLQEGWRTLRDGFYSPDMNGADWNAVLQRYRPLVDQISTPEEFDQIMRQLLGELNASHLGYYSASSSVDAQPDSNPDFGVDFDENYSGAGYRVSRVITNGPADQSGSRLYAGDVIEKINGTAIPAGDDRFKRLLNLTGMPLVLSVKNGAAAKAVLAEAAAEEAAAQPAAEPVKKNADAAKDAAKPDAAPPDTREVTVLPAPLGALRQLRYEQWVLDNRAMVDKLSGNKIAYLHIQGMDGPSLEKFRRELFSIAEGKDGLIIDVRFNGGGLIHEQLVSLLDRRPFAINKDRDSKYEVRQPALIWDKPIALLINAQSYSDAEIFPHIMQELGLAKIIGTPTGGNVIGTGDFQLLDGSGFRLPLVGWYMNDKTNMEGNGVQPDIRVDIDPNALAEGRDNQIQAAVDFLTGAKQ